MTTEPILKNEEFRDIDGALSPRLCRQLYGHKEICLLLKQSVQQNHLHHAWLLSGKKGIGKASFAYHAAKFLLSLKPSADIDITNPNLSDAFDAQAVNLIESGGHPDLFIMNRPYDDKKEDFKKNIPIDSARKLRSFLNLTASFSDWRVCIIDSVEDMNHEAANAILKILEEPPARTILFLITHHYGSVLDTIRSRCQKIPMQALENNDEVMRLLQELHPALDTQSGQAIAFLADGSIGQALHIAEFDGLKIYRDMVDVLSGLPNVDGELLHGFAGRIADKRHEKAFGMFTLFINNWLHGLIRSGAVHSPVTVLFEGEAELGQRFLAATPLEQWVDVWEKVTLLFKQSETLNLDKKQTILECFSIIKKAALRS